eukprot:10006738-Prorocentrum_lima.AAC.1
MAGDVSAGCPAHGLAMGKLSHSAKWHPGHGKTMTLSVVRLALVRGSALWTGGLEACYFHGKNVPRRAGEVGR